MFEASEDNLERYSVVEELRNKAIAVELSGDMHWRHRQAVVEVIRAVAESWGCEDEDFLDLVRAIER